MLKHIIKRLSRKFKISLLMGFILIIGIILGAIGVIGTIFLIGCLFYGPPDSPFTKIVGKDVKKNFIDTVPKQKEEVKLEGEYLLLYSQVHGSKKLLFLKNSKNKKIIKIFENQEERPNAGLIIPEKKIIIFGGISYTPGLDLYSVTTLRLYDYLNNTFVDEEILIPNDKDWILTRLLVSSDKKYICAEIMETKWGQKMPPPVLFLKPKRPACIPEYHYFYKFFEIKDNKLISIDKIAIEEITKGQINCSTQVGYICKTKDGNELNAFIIKPYSDFLPANYKPKYNGVYIHDKKENVNRRISLRTDFFTEPNVWLENGRKLIKGKYLFDTSGIKKESLLIEEGTILYVIKLK